MPEEYFIGEIRQKRYRILEDPEGLGKELSMFIEVDAGPSEHTPREEATPIGPQVKDFLSNEQKKGVILIQGPAGSGKSLLLQYLENNLWGDYQKGKPIPLFISLPSLKDPTSEAIQQVFRSLGASEKVFLSSNLQLSIKIKSAMTTKKFRKLRGSSNQDNSFSSWMAMTKSKATETST